VQEEVPRRREMVVKRVLPSIVCAVAAVLLLAGCPGRIGKIEHELIATTADGKAILEPVAALDFSPDGSVLAAAVANHVIRWDTSTGEVLERYQASDGSVFVDLAFNPSGAMLAGMGSDGTVFVWDGSTGSELGQLPVTQAPSEQRESVGSSLTWGSERHLTAASTQGQLVQWAVKEDEIGKSERRILLWPDGEAKLGSPIFDLAASSAGDFYAVSTDEAFFLWRITIDGFRVETLSLWARDFAVSPDGRWIVAVQDNESPVVYDLEEDRSSVLLDKLEYRQPDGPVTVAAWVPYKPDWVLVGADDGFVYVWDIRKPDNSLRAMAPFGSSGHRVCSVACNLDTARAAAGSGEGQVVVWRR
jgi:WD40 repeat protein